MFGLFCHGCLIGLLKQAKTLSKRQITLSTALLQQTRHPARNLAIFLLSIKAGLRAKEFASLTWVIAGSTPGDEDDTSRNEGDAKPVCKPQLFIQKSDAKDGDKNNAQLIDGGYACRVSQLQGTEIANP